MGTSLYLRFTEKSWKCPRCKSDFDHARSRMAQYCISCGLPKYYGSSYYFDKWGVANGKAMAAKIEAGEM